MSRMVNSGHSSHIRHTPRYAVGRRGLLVGGLAAGLGLAAPAAAPALPLDPESDVRAEGDPNFHPVQFRLPKPTGRKYLGTTSLHLIDDKRPDPTMPSGKRELMITLWYPTSLMADTPLAKYMPQRTAVEVDDSWTGEYGLALPTG